MSLVGRLTTLLLPHPRLTAQSGRPKILAVATGVLVSQLLTDDIKTSTMASHVFQL